MKKRAAVMAGISAVLCAVTAVFGQQNMPQDTGSAPESKPAVIELKPNTEKVVFEVQEPVGVPRALGMKDSLTPASDYGQILPYAASIIGWKQDGTPVYRYALADSAGELVTNAVYSSVERNVCEDQLIWVLTEQTEEGTRVSCAAHDGSWLLGPFEGNITVNESCILVQRTGGSVTTVYSSDGKIVGQVNGEVSSCSDGIVVSRDSTNPNIWYISDVDSAETRATLEATKVGAFSNGTATVQLTETEWGFVDEDGNITPVDAVWMDESCSGYALAKDAEGKFGVLSSSGKTAAEFVYLNGVQCGEELPLYQLWETEDTCIVLSAATGQKLMLPKDLHAQPLTALPESYFAYTNADGNTVVFDDLESFDLEGKASFYQQDDRWVIAVLEDGYQIFDLKESKMGKLCPYVYTVPQEQAAYQDSAFTITDPVTGLQGIGNVKGRIVLEPKYDSIVSADGSYFMAVSGCWSGIVDSNGDWIVRTMLLGTN